MRLQTTLRSAALRESLLIALACGAFVLGLAFGLTLPSFFSATKPLDRYFGNAIWKTVRASVLEHDPAARTVLVSFSDPYALDEKLVARLVYPEGAHITGRASDVRDGAVVGASFVPAVISPGGRLLALLRTTSDSNPLFISEDSIVLITRP